jgi:hypothetical protein
MTPVSFISRGEMLIVVASHVLQLKIGDESFQTALDALKKYKQLLSSTFEVHLGSVAIGKRSIDIPLRSGMRDMPKQMIVSHVLNNGIRDLRGDEMLFFCCISMSIFRYL